MSLAPGLTARVLVPATVLAEVEARSIRDDSSPAVGRSPHVQVVADVAVREQVPRWRLDASETQVLAQALTRPGSGVVLDDRAARRCARLLSIPTTGTLGVLALAKRKGRIAAAAPVLAALRDAGLHVTPALLQGVLRDLGEAP